MHRHWEIGRDAEAAYRPYDFYVQWETAWTSYQVGREDLRFVLLGAFDGDTMVGAGRTDVNLLDNLHSASSLIFVDPARQRQGIGRALDAACVEVARAEGRRVLMTEAFAPPGGDSAGVLFARAMGYAAGTRGRHEGRRPDRDRADLGGPGGQGRGGTRGLPGDHLARPRARGVRRRLLRARRGLLRRGADRRDGDRARALGPQAGGGAGGPQPAHRAARAVGRRDQPRRTDDRPHRADGQRADHHARLPERHPGLARRTAATSSASRSSSRTTGRPARRSPTCGSCSPATPT